MFVPSAGRYFLLVLNFFPGRMHGWIGAVRWHLGGHFGPQHADVVGRLDAHADRLSLDLQNREGDVGADLDLLLRLAREYEHGNTPLLDGMLSRWDGQEIPECTTRAMSREKRGDHRKAAFARALRTKAVLAITAA
jgi:hypothetical protein